MSFALNFFFNFFILEKFQENFQVIKSEIRERDVFVFKN